MKNLTIWLGIFAFVFGSGKGLTIVGSYSVPLDPGTRFEADYLQLLDENHNEYLILGYRSQRKINIYDFKKSELIRSLHFEIEGPNGIGTELGGFYFENFEEFYVLNYWEQKIHRFNSAEKIIKSYKIPRNISYPLMDESNSFCPITKIGSKLILSGILENHYLSKDYRSMLELNLENGAVTQFGKGPGSTYKNNFFMKLSTDYHFDSTNKELVLSYTVSDSLFFYDLNQNLKYKKLAKSKFIDKIPPLSEKLDYRPNNKDEVYKYLGLAYYVGIKYDPFRNYYYRFGFKTRTLNDIMTFAPVQPIILVLDQNFEVIGDYSLPYQKANYYLSMSFVREDGLYIPNKKHYDYVDESNLKFDIFLFN